MTGRDRAGVADLVLIAGRTLGRDVGQVLDLVDVAAAETALVEAQPGTDYADPALRAAELLHALARHRPLRRGNQQVALAAMLQFLAINGWDVDPDLPGPVAALVAGLAAGTVGTRDAAAFLAPRLRPGGKHDRHGHDDHAREVRMRPQPALPLAGTLRARPRPALRLVERTRFVRLDPRRRRVDPPGFTDRHRQVLDLSLDEARRLGHDHLGTEHLLLGLLDAGDGVAAQVLASLGIPLDEVRARVEDIIGPGAGARAGRILPTPQARRVLGLTPREALALGHHDVGTGHLLLALLREGHGIAAQVLTALGADHAQARQQVVNLVAGADEQAGPQTRLVRVAIPAVLADAAERLAQVQQQRKAALDADNLQAAAALEAREDQLRANTLRLDGRPESTSRPSSPKTSACTADSTGCALCSASTASNPTAAPPGPRETRSGHSDRTITPPMCSLGSSPGAGPVAGARIGVGGFRGCRIRLET